MLKKTVAVLAFSALALPMGAQANTPVPQGQSLTWDELKHACSDPGFFHSQVAPNITNIKCEDTKTSWEVLSTSAALSNECVNITISTDKYSVAPITFSSGMAAAPVCFRQQEVRSTRSLSLSEVTCEEIATFDSAQDYCASMLANTQPMRELTGRMIDSCAPANGNPVTSAPLPGNPSHAGRL
jgi:hypothetical protein